MCDRQRLWLLCELRSGRRSARTTPRTRGSHPSFLAKDGHERHAGNMAHRDERARRSTHRCLRTRPVSRRVAHRCDVQRRKHSLKRRRTLNRCRRKRVPKERVRRSWWAAMRNDLGFATAVAVACKRPACSDGMGEPQAMPVRGGSVGTACRDTLKSERTTTPNAERSAPKNSPSAGGGQPE